MRGTAVVSAIATIIIASAAQADPLSDSLLASVHTASPGLLTNFYPDSNAIITSNLNGSVSGSHVTVATSSGGIVSGDNSISNAFDHVTGITTISQLSGSNNVVQQSAIFHAGSLVIPITN